MQKRFESQGWDVQEIDGHNYEAIDAAIVNAKTSDKPSLIIAHTLIAKGAGELEGSHHSHGSPLGDEVIAKAKEAAGFDPEKKFFVDEDVMARFRCAIEAGDLAEREWKHRLKELPLMEQNEALEALQNPDFSRIQWPTFDTAEATRGPTGKVLNAVAKAIQGFVGGSADLSPSNKTDMKDMGVYPKGKTIYLGIREISLPRLFIPLLFSVPLCHFQASFLDFLAHLKPAPLIPHLPVFRSFLF